jgi:hypothetical protein
MSEPLQEPLYLPLGSCEIRLLTLYAGLSGEPIRCSLTHAVLQIEGKPHDDLDIYEVDRLSKMKSRKRRERWKQPSYQALSYCCKRFGLNFLYIHVLSFYSLRVTLYAIFTHQSEPFTPHTLETS